MKRNLKNKNVMMSSSVDPIKYPVSEKYKDAIPGDGTSVGNRHSLAHINSKNVQLGWSF